MTAPALDAGGYQRWRQTWFYPKADLPVPDAVLRGDGEKPCDEETLARACSARLGEPITLNALADQGTFHRVWQVERRRGPSLVCRANRLGDWFRDFPLRLEAHLATRLDTAGFPAPAIEVVDLTRESCPTDFLVMEKAVGRPLRDWDDDEEALRPLLFELGQVLARLHQIGTWSGYGLLDAVRPGVGSHRHWLGYIETRLEDHLEQCRTVSAVDPAEVDAIRQVFTDHRGVVENCPQALLHGDPGSHNVFAADGRITALIDWEDALIGDPVYEIAFWATFHPEHRHGVFLEGYRAVAELPPDFEPRFWLYFLRVALAKTVVRHRMGLTDRPGREPAARRIQRALARLDDIGGTVNGSSRKVA